MITDTTKIVKVKHLKKLNRHILDTYKTELNKVKHYSPKGLIYKAQTICNKVYNTDSFTDNQDYKCVVYLDLKLTFLTICQMHFRASSEGANLKINSNQIWFPNSTPEGIDMRIQFLNEIEDILDNLEKVEIKYPIITLTYIGNPTRFTLEYIPVIL